MNIDFIRWETHKGMNSSHHVLFIGLSTCGFCKKALEFLDEHSIEYDYIFTDRINPDDKARLKEEYKKQFGGRLLYPTAIIDGKEILTGFIKPSWVNALEPDAK
jgi:glutaredoxin-like protein NrdH